MEVACLISVEVGFNIELVVAEGFVLAYDTEEKACAGRGGVETFHLGRVGIHWNEIGGESCRRNGTVPVVIATHSDGSAYTHGKSGVAAHEEEVGCVGILEMTELVVIEVLY